MGSKKYPERKHLGYDSGKSSDRWFREHPRTGTGDKPFSPIKQVIKVIFKDGKK